MWNSPENGHFVEEILLAGEIVSPGTYRQIGSHTIVTLNREDHLPASLDGRVACYRKIALWQPAGGSDSDARYVPPYIADSSSCS